MATFTSTAHGDVIGPIDGENDDLIAIHNNVTLIGGSGSQQLFSDIDADGTIMEGGADDDQLVGQGANDTASYANSPVGVTVDLDFLGLGLFGFASDGDFLQGIEHVTGSGHADVITGDAGANILHGGGGNDTLTGLGGADTFRYSFEFTPGGGGGGGQTFSFTEFFAANGGNVTSDGKVAAGTKQGQFSSLYTQWLESLGLTVLDLGQNSGPGGTPIVEGPAGTFGERESFTWTSGGGKKTVTHERWYSDTWTSESGGGGAPSASSGDGFDTIVDFVWGVDKLEFQGLSGITLADFTSLFTASVGDLNNDGVTGTVLALAGGGWGVELTGVFDKVVANFYDPDVSLFS